MTLAALRRGSIGLTPRVGAFLIFADRCRRRLVPALLTALLVSTLIAQGAQAHSLKRSFADLKPRSGPDDFAVGAVFDLDPDDFEDTLFGRLDRDRSGRIEIEELQRHRELLSHLVGAGMVIERGGEACPAKVQLARVNLAAEMLRVHLQYACPAPGPLRVDFPILEKMRRGHVQFLVVRRGAGVKTGILTAQNPMWEDPDADLVALMGRFVWLGCKHILIGYDHLLFLFALLVVAGRLVELLKIVTAFTVAHSVTLILAGLGVISLPPLLVESAIALSIVAVGILNFLTPLATRGQNPERRAPHRWTRHRWLVTFGLGLVHGFGFAAVLGEMALPEHTKVLPLLAFNIGVEIGQLAVVLAVMPWLLALRRPAASLRLRTLLFLFGLAMGAAVAPFCALCGAAVGAMTGLAVWLTPRLGYHGTVVKGGSGLVIALGLFWFGMRLVGG